MSPASSERAKYVHHKTLSTPPKSTSSNRTLSPLGSHPSGYPPGSSPSLAFRSSSVYSTDRPLTPISEGERYEARIPVGSYVEHSGPALLGDSNRPTTPNPSILSAYSRKLIMANGGLTWPNVFLGINVMASLASLGLIVTIMKDPDTLPAAKVQHNGFSSPTPGTEKTMPVSSASVHAILVTASPPGQETANHPGVSSETKPLPKPTGETSKVPPADLLPNMPPKPNGPKIPLMNIPLQTRPSTTPESTPTPSDQQDAKRAVEPSASKTLAPQNPLADDTDSNRITDDRINPGAFAVDDSTSSPTSTLQESTPSSTSALSSENFDELPPKYESSAARSLKIPSILIMVAFIVLWMGMQTAASSVTGPTTVLATLPPTLPPHHSNVARGFPKFEVPSVEELTEQVNEKVNEVKQEVPEPVSEKVNDVKEQVTEEVADKLPDFTFGPFELRDNSQLYAKNSPKFDFFSSEKQSGGNRNLDDLPSFLFKPFLFWSFVALSVLGFLTAAIVGTATIIFMVKIFKGIEKFKNLLSELGDVSKIKDIVNDKLDGIKGDFERNLKDFWNKTITEDIKGQVDKIEGWAGRELQDALRKIKGLENINVNPLKFKRAEGGETKHKRNLPMIAGLGESDDTTVTVSYEKKDMPLHQKLERCSAASHIHSQELAVGHLMGTSTAPIPQIPTNTELPSISTAALQSPAHLNISASTPISNISSSSPTFNISSGTSITTFTAGASHLSVLPLFALLAKGLRSHRHSARPSIETRTTYDPWKNYHQIRSKASELCRSMESYTDELAAYTSEKLSCGDAFNQAHLNVRSDDPCEGYRLYKAMLEQMNEYCSGSSKLAAGQCLVLKKRNVQFKDQFCEALMEFGNAIEGVEECDSEVEGSLSAVVETSDTTFASMASPNLEEPTGSSSVQEADISSYEESESSSEETQSSSEEAQSSSEETQSSSEQSESTSEESQLPTTPTSAQVPASITEAAVEQVPNWPLSSLPSHAKDVPPTEWTVSMITFTSLITSLDQSKRLTTTIDSGNPPPWTRTRLENNWGTDVPFKIPVGYVAPNIVPSEPQIGHLTYYEGPLGACGYPELTDNELAVAISWELFDLGREPVGTQFAYSNEGLRTDDRRPIELKSWFCNRYIEVWMDDPPKVKQTFMVRDRCTACRPTDLDIRPDIFNRFWASKSVGRISVTWRWLPAEPTSGA